MKKVKELLGSLLVIVLLLGVGAFGGYYYATRYGANEIVLQDDGQDLKLPGETEVRVITANEVEAAIEEIQEFATYIGRYSVVKSEDDIRKEFGWDFFGLTTNSISIKCEGVVKVGYDLSGVSVAVDDESRTVYIKLPEPKVLDNYVIWDSVECEEKNNILNPIEFSQYQTIISEMESDGLEKVLDEGIFDAARENFRTVVTHYLSGITDYRIVVM